MRHADAKTAQDALNFRAAVEAAGAKWSRPVTLGL